MTRNNLYLVITLCTLFFSPLLRGEDINPKDQADFVIPTLNIWDKSSTETEYLVLPLAPSQWHKGGMDSTPDSTSIAFVPKGQSVKDWQNMVAIQVFKNLNGVDFKQFFELVKKESEKICGKIEEPKLIVENLSGDQQMAVYSQYCPKDPGIGTGRYTIYRGLAGKENLIVVQSIQKTPINTNNIDAAMVARWQEDIRSLSLCFNPKDVTECAIKKSIFDLK